MVPNSQVLFYPTLAKIVVEAVVYSLTHVHIVFMGLACSTHPLPKNICWQLQVWGRDPFRFELCPGPAVGQSFLLPGSTRGFWCSEDHFDRTPRLPNRAWVGCDCSRKKQSLVFALSAGFASRGGAVVRGHVNVTADGCKVHQNTLWTWDSNLIHQETWCNQ